MLVRSFKAVWSECHGRCKCRGLAVGIVGLRGQIRAQPFGLRRMSAGFLDSRYGVAAGAQTLPHGVCFVNTVESMPGS